MQINALQIKYILNIYNIFIYILNEYSFYIHVYSFSELDNITC